MDIKLRKLVLGIAFLCIYNLLLFYLGYNLFIWLKASFHSSHPVIIGIFLFVFSYAFVFAHNPNKLPLLRIIGSWWFAFIQYGLIIVPIANVLFYLLSFTSISENTLIVFTGSITVLIFVFLFAFGLYNAYSPVVIRYTIEIPKATMTMETLRIMFASDMHFGHLSGKKHAKKMVSLINESNPDIVLFGGDLIDDHPEPFMQKNMGDDIAQIRSRYGIYSVLGNHDYYGGKVPVLLDEMKRIGVKMLLDESILIDNEFYLVGRKDYSDKGREEFITLTESLDSEKFIISIDHQPHQLKEAMNAKVDLLLCGHTHKGQMAPNHFLTRKLFELDYGYKKIGQFHAFVSSGFGFWGPPIRIGSRSEIFQIDISFIKKSAD